ncbi:hypothetical protein GFS24_09335 [Chitinophaga sp. SYP-B3965]|uniref:hypothetical protein n=1 Tax=Chitinophaga sp. SYP-B3965 TaxID=2663120 RepID=UPI001299988C|nr:hypothetical protein [Chitinophaga sp. SYP-B3965]MRG45318.1 hypothetical protein [Chitinophaga sp. SYP-B3965]
MNITLLLSCCLLFISCNALPDNSQISPRRVGKERKVAIADTIAVPVPDTADQYKRQIQYLLHDKPTEKWQVPTGRPLPGAILPYKRIVAYYGNLYSSRMGILGELPPDEMLEKLAGEVNKWEKADTLFPVQPALHYIAVTAQSSPGASRKYRMRMPDAEIEKVLQMAQRIKAIVFLDIQVGLGTLQEEIPALDKYLRLPYVHLGIDPEYSMKNGKVPSTSVGTFDAADINYASDYLASLVQQYQLPPKVLVVHRFTQGMVTNYKTIKIQPEVQIIMNMDGFGSPAKKIDSYKGWIAGQPVEYTGFKLFYKNDVSEGKHLMEPEEVLRLFPRPIYIQYQ